MPTSATVLVLAAVLLPCVLYMWLAFRERPNVKSLADFFPLTRHLEGAAYSRSTVSAGVSLATVILALVNLAPFLGLGLLVTIGSYALSFLFLRWGATTILRANPANDTLQGWLGTAYDSKGVRMTALLFSFVGYVSIFSMELLVGVTVLEPFVGKNIMSFALIYLVFMIAYSIISGFKAIVATEQWQFRFVVAAVGVLVLMVPMLVFGGGKPVPLGEIATGLLKSWTAPWAFALGIICMNLPAPFADAATWQRLCATRSEEDARRGLGRAIPWFILIWGGLIVCAALISAISVHLGAFDPAKGTLMNHLMTTLAQGGSIGLGLLFLFVLGLFSAMITTADSLLLVSSQMFIQDFRRIQPSKDAAKNAHGLRAARTALAAIGLLSFGVFALFQWLKFDVVQLIFAIYGAHIALFPAVFAALFLKRRLRLEKAWPAAAISTAIGFIAGWVGAIYGKNTGKTDWLYNAPAVSLIVASALFLLLSLPHWKRNDAS
jgi:Na+/proline symporter